MSAGAAGQTACKQLSPMILAAGHATRLRPLTDSLAKAVVPFLNRPLLDYSLDWLAQCGFDRVLINLHHAAESIRECYGDLAFGMQVEFSHEPVLLGTGGGPRAAIDRLGPRLLIVNGDVVARIPPGPLLRHHLAAGSLATLALHQGEAAAAYPQVTAHADGRLLAFPGDDPETLSEAGVADDDDAMVSGVFTGVHIVERSLLETLPEGVPAAIVSTAYRAALDEGLPISAVPASGPWYEAGELDRYIDTQLLALARGDLPLAVRGHRRKVPGGYVSRHTHLENVRLLAPYLVGAGSRIKHGAYVRAAVLADRVRVGPGAWLEECIAWPDSSIGTGAHLRRAVVMRGVRVPAGTRAERVVFTPEGPVPFAAAVPA